MNKSGKRAVFKLSALAALLTTALSTQAAGLGKLSVYSGIGQPLNAEVVLSASPAELASMSAKLASHEAFQDAGIDFMPALSGMRFSIVKQANNQVVLRMTTDRPVNEPFLHFLIELNWTAGRMMREYTFLLDPPEMLQVAKPSSVVAPVKPAVSSLPPPAPATTTKPAVSSTRAAPEAPKAAEAPSASEYTVKRGDTLGKIARELKPESASLDQMLAALFNGNPEAFGGGNMNRLRAGKILKVPDAEQVGKVDAAEARKLVIGQAAEFNAYRRQLAAATAGTPATAESAPRQQVSGAIKPQVEEKTPAAPPKDKLEVSRTEPAKSAKAGAGTLEEDLIARDRALREASERIVLLEKNIENLKRLVEIKSQAGAKLQQESQAAAKPAEAQKPAEKPVAETVVAKPAEPAAAAPAPAAEPAKVAEAAAAKPAEPAPTVPPVPPAEKKPAASPPPPPAEPSFIEENPQVVYGGGGLVALLLAYLGYSSWRRKKQPGPLMEDLLASTGAAAGKSPEVAAAPVAATAMENAEVSIQSNFGEGSLMTTEEIVDPVAEADVLMAYGRDKQAEEILQEGLKHDPVRTAIHMKLLDLYAKQENLAQFETVATELHKQSGGRGAEWDKAVLMAHKLGISTGIFMTAETTAAPQASASPAITEAVSEVTAIAPQEAVTQAAEKGELLDFDLDLGTTSQPAESPAPVLEPVAPPAAEEAGLDFDFDLGAPEAAPAVEAAVEQAVATPAEAPAATDFDFDLDLGTTSETGAIEAAKEAVATTAAMPEVAGAELPAAVGAAVPETPAASDHGLDFDLDLDSGAPAAPAVENAAVETAAAAAATALADISLDLELPPEQAESLSAGEVQKSVEITGDAQPNPEAATKLELAQAYEEMGDLEGARELLNEVLNDGSAAQQAQARAKLDQLAG